MAPPTECNYLGLMAQIKGFYATFIGPVGPINKGITGPSGPVISSIKVQSEGAHAPSDVYYLGREGPNKRILYDK